MNFLVATLSRTSNQNKPKAKTTRFTFLEYFLINVTNDDRSHLAKRIGDRVSHVKPQFEEEKRRSNASSCCTEPQFVNISVSIDWIDRILFLFLLLSMTWRNDSTTCSFDPFHVFTHGACFHGFNECE